MSLPSGNSETVARLGADGLYRATGYKFFTSASTSDVTMMLARVADKDGNTIKVRAYPRESLSSCTSLCYLFLFSNLCLSHCWYRRVVVSA